MSDLEHSNTTSTSNNGEAEFTVAAVGEDTVLPVIRVPCPPTDDDLATLQLELEAATLEQQQLSALHKFRDMEEQLAKIKAENIRLKSSLNPANTAQSTANTSTVAPHDKKFDKHLNLKTIRGMENVAHQVDMNMAQMGLSKHDVSSSATDSLSDSVDESSKRKRKSKKRTKSKQSDIYNRSIFPSNLDGLPFKA